MLKVRRKYNHWFPGLFGATAITLYPFILFACTEKEALDSHTLQHEWVHIEQVRKLGWLRFYLSYVWNFVKEYAKERVYWTAYLANPYEKEAYEKEKDFKLPEILE